jgi:hypothetical protein
MPVRGQAAGSAAVAEGGDVSYDVDLLGNAGAVHETPAGPAMQETVRMPRSLCEEMIC